MRFSIQLHSSPSCTLSLLSQGDTLIRDNKVRGGGSWVGKDFIVFYGLFFKYGLSVYYVFSTYHP